MSPNLARWMLAAGTLLLAQPGPSTAHATVTGPPELLEAVARMAVPPPHDTVVLLASCPADASYNGCAYAADATHRAHVYVRPGRNAFATQSTLYHELGHVFVGERPWVLRRFRAIIHTRMGADALHERFADAYDNCARRQRSPGPYGESDPWSEFDYSEWNDGHEYHPWPRTHRRVCRLIRRVEFEQPR